MFSLLLFVLISIGNLCLGYALAVYLGYGLDIREFLHAWAFPSPSQAEMAYEVGEETSDSEHDEPFVVPPLEEELEEEDEPLPKQVAIDLGDETNGDDNGEQADQDDGLDAFLDFQEPQAANDAVSESAEEIEQEVNPAIDEIIDSDDEIDEAESGSDIEPQTPQVDDEILVDLNDELEDADAESLDQIAETEEEQVEDPFKQAYESLSRQTQLFSGEMARLDKQLREMPEEGLDEGQLQGCVEELTQAIYRSQQGLQEAMEPIVRDESASDRSADVRRQAIEILDQLDECYNELLNGLLGVSFDEQLACSTQEVGKAVLQLLTACHRTRSRLEEPLIEIAHLESGLHNLEFHSYRDEQTSLADRLGLEAALADWWRNDPQQEQPLSLGVLDMDQMGEINRQHGAQAGDELLRAIGELMQTGEGAPFAAARVAGQQFVLVYGKCQAEQASQHLNELRQRIAAEPILCGATEIPATATVAVAQVAPGEDSNAILFRMRDTLRQAKQQQNNGTVLCTETISRPQSVVDQEASSL